MDWEKKLGEALKSLHLGMSGSQAEFILAHVHKIRQDLLKELRGELMKLTVYGELNKLTVNTKEIEEINKSFGIDIPTSFQTVKLKDVIKLLEKYE